MFVRSKIVPDCVQTGCSKGCSDSEQNLNGRRLKDAPSAPSLALPTPAPALAEYASSEAHSECVIYEYHRDQWKSSSTLRDENGGIHRT